MKEQELDREYKRHVRELKSDFTPDQSQPPWKAQLSPGEFREIKQYGTDHGRPVTLQVIDTAYLSENFNQQSELTRIYNQLVGKHTPAQAPVIRLPQMITIHGTSTSTSIIWERPEGQRIISDEESSQSFNLGDTIWHKIRESACLIKATGAVLEKLSISTPLAKQMVVEQFYTDYFLGRFKKWNEERRRAGVTWNPTTKKIEVEILWKVLNRYKLISGDLQIGWNVCGNTDLIKTPAGQYYLINGRFEVKPAGFLPAAWIWNMVLHGSLVKNRVQLYNNTMETLQIFRAQHFTEASLIDNLLERLFAGRFVDAELRRSPFHQTSKDNWQRAKKNISFLLERLTDEL